MPDVRGLVGIDIGVLDDDLGGVGGRRLAAIERARSERTSIEAGVNVSRAGGLERPNSGNRREFGDQFGSDLTRWPPQSLGEAEANRGREVSVRGLLGQFDDHLRLHSVTASNMGRQGISQALF